MILLDDVLSKSRPRDWPADRSGLDACCGTATHSCANSVAGWIRKPQQHSTSGMRLAQIGERLARSRAELVEALSPYAAEAFSILATQAGSFKMRYVCRGKGH